ncbi:hypothetical protein MRX96_016524 [Rhipicephalus microplus]
MAGPPAVQLFVNECEGLLLHRCQRDACLRFYAANGLCDHQGDVAVGKFRTSITVDRRDSPSWCVSGIRRNRPRFAALGYCQGGTGADSGAWGLAALCWPGSFIAPTRTCPFQEKRPGASRQRLAAADD